MWLAEQAGGFRGDVSNGAAAVLPHADAKVALEHLAFVTVVLPIVDRSAIGADGPHPYRFVLRSVRTSARCSTLKPHISAPWLRPIKTLPDTSSNSVLDLKRRPSSLTCAV